MEKPGSHRCANCETELVGEWCHGCGQRRFRPEHRTLSHLAAEFLRATVDLDGRLWKSLRGLLLAPGRMARDYLAGARRRYLSPVTLFLLANLLYFLAPPLTDLNPSLYEHLNLQPYSGAAAALVDQRLVARAVTAEEYAAAFNARQASLARSLVALHLPFLALALAAMHVFRRRPLADHLLVALYLMTFCLLAVLAVPPVLGVAGRLAGLDAASGGLLLRVGLAASLAGWSFAVLRGAYAQPGWLAALKTPPVLAAIFASNLAYRGLLFLITFALT